ncbi:hypothetical protein ARTHRO9V_210342 [Arthrobacter sp. 9V]|nr:hypothetical protein ARTHRO9V_210342 [Arthrobacter sp. 9V]
MGTPLNPVNTGELLSRVRTAYLSARMASSTTTCVPSSPPNCTHISDSSSSSVAVMVPSTTCPVSTTVRPSAALAVRNAVVPSVDQRPGTSSMADGWDSSHWKEVSVNHPCSVASAECLPARNRSQRASWASVAVVGELMVLLGWCSRLFAVVALASTMSRAWAFPHPVGLSLRCLDRLALALKPCQREPGLMDGRPAARWWWPAILGDLGCAPSQGKCS